MLFIKQVFPMLSSPKTTDMLKTEVENAKNQFYFTFLFTGLKPLMRGMDATKRMLSVSVGVIFLTILWRKNEDGMQRHAPMSNMQLEATGWHLDACSMAE